MDKSELIGRLQEYNREMAELAELSFIKKMSKSGLTIKFEKGKEIKTDTRFPDNESIKAICNDMRKFIQKNDPLGVENLSKVYNSSHIEQNEKEMFDSAIKNYRTFMASPTEVKINNKQITNGEVMKIFLYGKFSHRSLKEKKIHDYWQNNPMIYPFLKNIFLTILFQHVHFVSDVGYVNNCVLEKLGHVKIVGVVTNE